MAEQAPALTRTPPGSGTSLASCPRVSCVPQDMGTPASLEDSQHAAPERGGLSRVERQQMNVHMGGVAAVFPWQADKKKSVFMISNTMIANAVIYGGKYEGEKMGL